LIRVRAELERRIRLFINLPFASLDRMSAQCRVDDIGRSAQTSDEESSSAEARHLHQRKVCGDQAALCIEPFEIRRVAGTTKQNNPRSRH
jgi:hypothetical protein